MKDQDPTDAAAIASLSTQFEAVFIPRETPSANGSSVTGAALRTARHGEK
jgi:hypothetical protein